MTTYILDSSAVLRYFDDELGADRVEEVVSACAAAMEALSISAIQWGEIAGKLRKRLGASEASRIMSTLLPSEAQIVPATADRAIRAANLRVDIGIGYADAFAAELAMDVSGSILVTADYGFQALKDLATVEFLPAK